MAGGDLRLMSLDMRRIEPNTASVDSQSPPLSSDVFFLHFVYPALSRVFLFARIFPFD